MDGTLLTIAGVLGLGAVWMLLLATSRRAQVRALSRPTSPVGKAPPGPVKLLGQVDAEETFEAPLSQKRCVYLRVVIRASDTLASVARQAGTGSGGRWGLRLGGSGLGSGLTIPLGGRSGEDAGPGAGGSIDHVRKPDRLILRDDSGEVEVDPEHLETELEVDRSETSRPLSDTDPEVARVLRNFQLGGRTGMEGSFRLQEIFLEPGDRVLVTGRLEIAGDGRRVVRGSAEEPVYLTDQNASALTAGVRRAARGYFWAGLLAAALAGWLVVVAVLAPAKTPTPSGESPLPTFERPPSR